MKPLDCNETCYKFVEYFENRGHKHCKSSPLNPEGKDLFFTNAGMNQFKDVFLGLKTLPYKRAVSIQKCFRANDLEQVGHTPRHHTFFEMLGNFSFGDYFKKEAIAFAWEFLTDQKYLGIDKDRLYVTVFNEDEESFNIWKKIWENDKADIKRSLDEFIKKDSNNFWKMASTGPCGPCSEVFYHYGQQDVEIWNLVFMQFDQQTDGSRLPLPQPCVDTGAGLERLTSVTQRVNSNFEADLFIDTFYKVLNCKLESDIWKNFKHQHYQLKKQEQIEEKIAQKVVKEFLEDLFKRSNRIKEIIKEEEEKINREEDAYKWKAPSASYLFQDNLHFNMIYHILKRAESGPLRKVFLDFVCEEFQKERGLISPEKIKIDEERKIKDRIALCQIADHVRGIAFLLLDGILPSNEGRGYVLRKLFKKVRHCLQQIGIGSFNFLQLKRILLVDDLFVYDCYYLYDIIMTQNPDPFIYHYQFQKQKKFYQQKSLQYQEDSPVQKNIAKLMSLLIREIQQEILYQEGEEINLIIRREQKQANKKSQILNRIYQIAEEIETTFKKKLEDNEEIFNKEFDDLEQKMKPKTLTAKILGEFAFKLFETHGLSKDNTKDLIKRKMKKVNFDENFDQIFEEAFETHLKKAQELSRAKPKYLQEGEKHLRGFVSDIIEQSAIQSVGPSRHQIGKFVGYETLSTHTQIIGLSDGQKQVTELKAGQTGFVIFDQTPFYAESGGQIGDQGEVKDSSGNLIAQIKDCQKYKEVHYHFVDVKIHLNVNDKVFLQVYKTRREEITKHHTATHLLHTTLRDILKEKVKIINREGKKEEQEMKPKQKGSLVTDHYLRFDFTHPKPLTTKQKEQIQKQINKQIIKALPITTETMSFKDAEKRGALAFFNEKYPEGDVHVVKIGENISIELCGGTHVKNTSELQAFLITSEESISANIRRITALSGQEAIDVLSQSHRELAEAKKEAQTNKNLSGWISEKKKEIKDLHKQIQKLTVSQIEKNIDINKIIEQSPKVSGILVVKKTINTDDRECLRQIADKIRNKIQSGIVILSGEDSDKPPLMVAVTKNLIDKYNAVDVLRKYGKGGGRPDFAQGYQTVSFKLPLSG